MAHHAACRNALEIQFEGESGFGTGVTQNFYSSVAAELLRAKTNAALPVWLADAADAGGADGDGFIAHGGALFPRPLAADAAPETVAAVCAYFRFLGRLMAKACREQFIVPLPLSDLALPHGARVLFYGDGALRQVAANVLAASQLRGDAGRDELKWTRWEPAGTPDLHKFGRDFPGCVAGADAASSGSALDLRQALRRPLQPQSATCLYMARQVARRGEQRCGRPLP